MSSSEITRREFTKLSLLGIGSGILLGRGLSEFLKVRRSEHEKSLLGMDFRLLQDKIEQKTNAPIYQTVFVYLPYLLKRESLVNNSFWRFFGNNEWKLSGYEKEGFSVGIELLADPSGLSTVQKDVYDFLHNLEWPDPILTTVFEEKSKAAYQLKHCICGEEITVGDVLALSFSLPAKFEISKRDVNPDPLFQNDVLDKLFGYNPSVVLKYGFGVLTLASDWQNSSFLGINRIAGFAFRDWILNKDINLDSQVSVSSNSDPATFIFEDLCQRGELTYTEVISFFENSSIHKFASRLISGLDRSRFFTKEEIGVGFLNLNSYVEEVAPRLAVLPRESWKDSWKKGIGFFSSNMLPVLSPSLGPKKET